MNLSLRGALVLVIGVVLGLSLAFSTTVWTALTTHQKAQIAATDPAIESAATIAEVIDRVRREYVDRVDDKRIVEAAIRGIVSDLDQHSTFLNAEQYEAIRITTSGNYTGIGLDVNLEGGKVTVVNPLDGAPAARAGIRPGDVVVSVDNVPVDEKDVSATVARMRGAPGTPVTLDVVRDGTEVPMRFALTRSSVQVKSVAGEYLGNGLAYLKLSSFTDSTPRDLDATVRELLAVANTDKLLGVVLDLRGNPGGVLDAAVHVADKFLADGLIVSGSGRVQQARFEQFAHPGDLLEGVPTVVLVNRGSASASEIVAGALQDHHRARIVGETTYGKGSVQTVMPLGEGTAIKLTTSRYLTPSGRSINGSGIEPDIVVHNADANAIYHGAAGSVSLRDDSQLFEAIRLISYDSIATATSP